MLVVVTGTQPHRAVGAAHLTSARRQRKDLSAASAAAPGCEPRKVAVSSADSFLTGLLQYVIMCFSNNVFPAPLFPPAGLIEKNHSNRKYKIYPESIAGGWGVSREPPLGGIYVLKLEGEQVLWKWLVTA